jgi:hypothetical protein
MPSVEPPAINPGRWANFGTPPLIAGRRWLVILEENIIIFKWLWESPP